MSDDQWISMILRVTVINCWGLLQVIWWSSPDDDDRLVFRRLRRSVPSGFDDDWLLEEAVSKQSNMRLHAFVLLWLVQHGATYWFAKAGFQNMWFANIFQTPIWERNSCRQNQDHVQLSSNLSDYAINSGKSKSTKQNSMLFLVKCPFDLGFRWVFRRAERLETSHRQALRSASKDWIVGLKDRTTLKDYLANHDSVATRTRPKMSQRLRI